MKYLTSTIIESQYSYRMSHYMWKSVSTLCAIVYLEDRKSQHGEKSKCLFVLCSLLIVSCTSLWMKVVIEHLPMDENHCLYCVSHCGWKIIDHIIDITDMTKVIADIVFITMDGSHSWHCTSNCGWKSLFIPCISPYQQVSVYFKSTVIPWNQCLYRISEYLWTSAFI